MKKLIEFIQRYHVSNIERFNGTHKQRVHAVKRAMSRVGEKAYNLVFNNCEHFKNWVMHGKDISHQTTYISASIVLAATGSYILGVTTDSSGFRKVGRVILILLVIIILVAFAILMLQFNQNKEESHLNHLLPKSTPS